MVSLRTSDGFDLDECAYRYGRSAAETIRCALADAERRGLVMFLTPEQQFAMPKLSNGDYPETESSYIGFVDSGSPFLPSQSQLENMDSMSASLLRAGASWPPFSAVVRPLFFVPTGVHSIITVGWPPSLASHLPAFLFICR